MDARNSKTAGLALQMVALSFKVHHLPKPDELAYAPLTKITAKS